MARLVRASVIVAVLAGLMVGIPVFAQATPFYQITGGPPAGNYCVPSSATLPTYRDFPNTGSLYGTVVVAGVGIVQEDVRFDFGPVSGAGTWGISHNETVPAGTQITVTIWTYAEPVGGTEPPVYQTELVFNCTDGSVIAITNTDLREVEPEEPVVQEPVPGCDALIAIPSTAVGAKITADTLAYWAPGQATTTTLQAGTSVRAISQADGWYEILYVCDFLYVPVGTIGPNPEAPWFGAPLP